MKLDKPIALALAVLGLVAAHAMAQKNQEPAPASSKEVVAQFDRLDADKDGHVSTAEAQQLNGLPESFAKADRNGDGRLDVAEFEASLRR